MVLRSFFACVRQLSQSRLASMKAGAESRLQTGISRPEPFFNRKTGPRSLIYPLARSSPDR